MCINAEWYSRVWYLTLHAIHHFSDDLTSQMIQSTVSQQSTITVSQPGQGPIPIKLSSLKRKVKNVRQELSYRKQIARQLRTQYVEGIYDNHVSSSY